MSHRRRRARNVARRRRRRRWPWIGLGLLGGAAALALLARKSAPLDDRAASGDSDLDDDGFPPRDSVADGASTLDPLAMPADAREAWVPGPSGSLRIVERHPDADLALVFVHGLGGRLEHWAQQIACLGPSLAGVAFDLPGHGGSDDLDTAAALDCAAGALGAAIDCAGPGGTGARRPLIIAHGWGCLPALRWAARHPGRARGLLLLDPPADQSRMPAADVEAFTNAVAEDARGELGFFVRQSLADVPADLAERLAAGVDATSDDVLEACLRASSTATPAADAVAARVPVHVATSDLGRLPQSIQSLVPAVTAWHLPGGSHWCMIARPAQLNQLIDDVLDSLRASPAV